MKIKVIKKNANSELPKSSNISPSTENKIKDLERNAKQTISHWISELREQKNLDFLRTQSFLTSVQ